MDTKKVMIIRDFHCNTFNENFIESAIRAYADRHGENPTKIAFSDIDASDRQGFDGLSLPDKICGINRVDVWENLSRHTVALWRD